MEINLEKIKFIILIWSTIILSSLLAFVNLEEYIKIGILNRTAGYPFGAEGPVPWYYKTSDIYAKVNLFFGLIFLLLLILAIRFTIMNKKSNLIFIFLASFVFLLIQIFNGIND